jgi:hypothetical protein
MKRTSKLNQSSRAITVPAAILLISALCLWSSAPASRAQGVEIVPPGAKFHGKTYGQWAAAFWQWAFALPLEGHPFLDTPEYNFAAGQQGSVWYWSSSDGPITRTVTLPAGKALFLTIRDVETSTLEDPPFFGQTETEQRANSHWWADHIINVFCVIDGVAVPNLQAYRFETPQFRFTAPTPWIFAATGGKGTSVGEGYFLMLQSLSAGAHVIHYGGTFHLDAGELGDDPLDFPHDVTIQLTVEGTDDKNERKKD